MAGDKGGPHDVGFAVSLEDFLDDFARQPLWCHLDIILRCDVGKSITRHRRVNLGADRFACSIDHSYTRPRVGKVNVVAPNRQRGRPDRITSSIGDEALSDVHHVGPVGKRLIELHHRELGVMPS